MRRRRSAAVAVTPSALSSTTFTAKKRRLKRSPPVVRLSSTATTDQLTPQVTMPCEEAHVNTGVSLMDLPDELLDHIVSFTSAALIGPDIKPNGMPYKRAGPFLALAQTNKRLNEICNAPRPPIAVTVPVYDTTQDSKIYAYNFNLGSPQPGQPMPPYRSRVVIGEKTVMRQMPSRAEFQKRLHACHLCKRYNAEQWREPSDFEGWEAYCEMRCGFWPEQPTRQIWISTSTDDFVDQIMVEEQDGEDNYMWMETRTGED